MYGSRGQPLLAAKGMGNLHVMIIYHYGQVIGGHSIGFEQYLIVEGRRIETLLSSDHVGKSKCLLLGHLYAYNVRSTGFEQFFCSISSQCQ